MFIFYYRHIPMAAQDKAVLSSVSWRSRLPSVSLMRQSITSQCPFLINEYTVQYAILVGDKIIAFHWFSQIFISSVPGRQVNRFQSVSSRKVSPGKNNLVSKLVCAHVIYARDVQFRTAQVRKQRLYCIHHILWWTRSGMKSVEEKM
jgi:hypothetical protein